MDITPLVPNAAKILQSYGPKGFMISGAVFDTSVIILPEEVLPWPQGTDLTPEAFAPVFEAAEKSGCELLLIGTGADHRFLPPTLKAALHARALPHEAMDTGAACRTWNVVLSEGRNAAAALILPAQADK